MRTIEDFRCSVAGSAPPTEFGPALRALWWTSKGDWHRAHACVQRHGGDPACDLVHAHLHRREGDLENASHWYRDAGRALPTTPLDGERDAIATELLAGDRR